MNKNVRLITVVQVLYAIGFTMCRYALIGFSNLEIEVVLNDLLFTVPITIGIISLTTLCYSGAYAMKKDFEIKKKADSKKEKQKTE